MFGRSNEELEKQFEENLELEAILAVIPGKWGDIQPLLLCMPLPAVLVPSPVPTGAQTVDGLDLTRIRAGQRTLGSPVDTSITV